MAPKNARVRAETTGRRKKTKQKEDFKEDITQKVVITLCSQEG